MIDVFLYATFYVVAITILFLVLKRDWIKLEKFLKYLVAFLSELVYELGKGAFIAGLIGIYFIPENKDFAMAIKYGIIFYIVGFFLNKK